MPIYDFECTNCGERFERLQKLSDPDPEICPKCGAHQVKRRLTAPAFRLAGKGWYETDFKKDGDRKRNLAASDDAPRPESKSDGAEAKSSDGAKSDSTKSEPAKADAKDSAKPVTKAKPEGNASA